MEVAAGWLPDNLRSRIIASPVTLAYGCGTPVCDSFHHTHHIDTGILNELASPDKSAESRRSFKHH
jgi:hypothetical protein